MTRTCVRAIVAAFSLTNAVAAGESCTFVWHMAAGGSSKTQNAIPKARRIEPPRSAGIFPARGSLFRERGGHKRFVDAALWRDMVDSRSAEVSHAEIFLASVCERDCGRNDGGAAVQ